MRTRLGGTKLPADQPVGTVPTLYRPLLFVFFCFFLAANPIRPLVFIQPSSWTSIFYCVRLYFSWQCRTTLAADRQITFVAIVLSSCQVAYDGLLARLGQVSSLSWGRPRECPRCVCVWVGTIWRRKNALLLLSAEHFLWSDGNWEHTDCYEKAEESLARSENHLKTFILVFSLSGRAESRDRWKEKRKTKRKQDARMSPIRGRMVRTPPLEKCISINTCLRFCATISTFEKKTLSIMGNQL